MASAPSLPEVGQPPRAVLGGLRVLEIGHFIAAPFGTRLLADLGADVIKVEPLAGDPIRKWGDRIDGRSLWWSVHARNKRSIALDLKSARGRQIVLELVKHCDAVVENFRPGQLDKMGLGPAALRAVRPDLVICSVSGYGQTGPDRDKASFGVIGEAVGGLRYLTNHPPGTSDLPPVRTGVSIGDSIAGLYGAFGVLAALWQRDRAGGDGMGRTVDVALNESVLSMMEGMLPEYGRFGKIRQPAGGGIATAAPSNAYRSREGDWILIGANSDPLFTRLCALMGQPELATDPAYVDNPSRVANAAALDRLTEADIPHSKVYTAEDCANDPQYLARGMVREVEDPKLGPVLHSGIVPHFPETPGSVRWTGADIGAHGDEVLSELLGLDKGAIAALRNEGVLG